MFSYKHHRRRAVLLLICMTVLATGVSAQEAATVDVQPGFSAEDFAVGGSGDGIFVTSVPSASTAVIYYGSRALRAGDAVPSDGLDQLWVQTVSTTEQSAAIGYRTVSGNQAGPAQELKFSILPRKNDPPTAKSSTLETYRNIAVTGELSAEDPEGGPLTYTLVLSPRRGDVELYDDGTFTYTPKENKVGKDSFSFTVTDDAGQTSEPAKVTIEIKKPSDKRTYADMTDDPNACDAMWMKEAGLYSGSTIGGHLCFGPEEPVSRGEFLVMTMKLVGAEADTAQLHSGFADEDSSPLWMQPYIVSALQNGMVSGIQTDDGVEFRPTDSLTRAEAAVMLQNILQLPEHTARTVSATDEKSAVPVWAADAVCALSTAGIELEPVADDTILTRREAAAVLHQVNDLLEQALLPTFYWVQ